MSRWYKFGNYHGWGTEPQELDSKDGIIVTSMANESSVKDAKPKDSNTKDSNANEPPVDKCRSHTEWTQDILAFLAQSASEGKDWYFMRHDEVRGKVYTVRMEASVPAKASSIFLQKL